MKYVFLLLFMAAVFGVCRAVDLLIRKFAPKIPQRESGKAVRLPHRSIVFGILLTFFGIASLIGFFEQMKALYRVACIAVTAMGVFLLVQYGSFGVFYDAESFVYRTLRRGKHLFRYGEIIGQRSLLTRSGVNTVLLLRNDEQVVLSESMDGVREFLQFAFHRWCEATGTDPETVKNNPEMLTYFPETEER